MELLQDQRAKSAHPTRSGPASRNRSWHTPFCAANIHGINWCLSPIYAPSQIRSSGRVIGYPQTVSHSDAKIARSDRRSLIPFGMTTVFQRAGEFLAMWRPIEWGLRNAVAGFEVDAGRSFAGRASLGWLPGNAGREARATAARESGAAFR